MKKFIILCIICLQYVNVSGQVAQTARHRDVIDKKAIDKSTLAVTYRAKVATDTTNRFFYYDNQILAIGDKYKHYYSKCAEDIDSAKYKIDKGIIKNPYDYFYRFAFLGKTEDGTYEDIFTDLPEKGVNTVYTRFYERTYVYKEPTPVFEWTIIGSKDTVLGYECQEARTRFRGREYVAWFTLEIPISAGPWKLNGLPGLILKAHDTDSLYQYTAVGISQKDSPIYLYETKAQKCTRKDILKFNDLRWKDSDMLSGRESIRIGADGEVIDQKQQIPKYIPQHELE